MSQKMAIFVDNFIAPLQNLGGGNHDKAAKVLVKMAGLRAEGRNAVHTKYEVLIFQAHL
jgi:hypothetical protein